ncbi:hypothetical protein BJF79_25525 [Actinomadura sp. CNU-125]|uniref:WXG100 family type VII secretion target n=1 Tax=Actinomadura sp. CNU-125 TaxID=1904961 RepID=UPI0009662A9D|nr:WXG100 family type VII secretion target [Actinomadura sp. CNU-125]OLT10834.1 hypothetical protein BJF79_25525 [Actinomadura sp. CNU-125]
MGENSEQFPIRDGKTFPSQDFSGMSFDDVKNKLSSIRPEAVGDASTAYKDAADILAQMTEKLRTEFAERIKNNWQGESAQKALDQLGQIYTTAGTLSDKSHNTASTYNWYKVSILDWYKNAAQDMEDGYIHTDGDDENARKFIAKFSRRMGEAYDAHPNNIEKDLPREYGGLNDNPTMPNYPGGNPGGPGGMPGGGGSIPGGAPGGMPGGGMPGGAPGGMPGGGGGSFAGENPFSPPSNNGPHLQPGEVTPGGSWGAGSGPGGLGSGSGGLGGSPWSGGSGAPTCPASRAEAAEAAACPVAAVAVSRAEAAAASRAAAVGACPVARPARSAESARAESARAPVPRHGEPQVVAGGAAGGRPMGMPMAPGGGQGGQGDQERERETWLTEDEDVWGADDDTAPPVIG